MPEPPDVVPDVVPDVEPAVDPDAVPEVAGWVDPVAPAVVAVVWSVLADVPAELLVVPDVPLVPVDATCVPDEDDPEELGWVDAVPAAVVVPPADDDDVPLPFSDVLACVIRPDTVVVRPFITATDATRPNAINIAYSVIVAPDSSEIKRRTTRI